LLLVGAKPRTLFLDRDRLGKWQRAVTAKPFKFFPLPTESTAPGLLEQSCVFFAARSVLKNFALERGKCRSASSAGTTQFIDRRTPTISSNDRVTELSGLAFEKLALARHPAILYAYDAANVAHELYNSEQNNTRIARLCLRFNIRLY